MSRTDHVTLQINGRMLTAAPGQTILQVAKANGIYIPTLCDYPGLPPGGSCRMCIVEVQGRKNTPTACTTPVQEGMVVETETAQIRDLRQELLRMLLADHPAGCLFCPETGHCQECMVTLHKSGITTGCRNCPADGQCTLQDLVAHSGLKSVAYPVRYRALKAEKSDPFFDRDYNLCVLCGRCIQVCESLHFNNIPAYVQRGSRTRVGTSFGLSHLEAGCSFCGACVDACPTGALSEKTRKWDGKPDEALNSTCLFCSLGCSLQLLTKKQDKMMILGTRPEQPGEMLCVKGRFGVTEMVNHPQRMKEVLRAERGQVTRSNWNAAVQAAASVLSDCAPESFALAVSASCTSEELFIADKFAREVMGSGAVLSAEARYGHGLNAVRRLLARSEPLEALKTADLILCVGVDAHYACGTAEALLKHAGESGIPVITLNSHPHVPGRNAALWLKPHAGMEEETLLDLLNRYSLGRSDGAVGQAAQQIALARQLVVLAGPEALAQYPEALERFVEAAHARLAAIPAEGNLAGALRLGLGGAPARQNPRVLYLVGTALPADLSADTYTIYQNTHLPDQIPAEGLILPMAGYGETDGSMMDQGGRIKPLASAASPAGDALPGWEILCRVARAMGKPGFDYRSVEKIQSEMNEYLDAQPECGQPSLYVRPNWLTAPAQHDYMGADLDRWVSGLGELADFGTVEVKHVEGA